MLSDLGSGKSHNAGRMEIRWRRNGNPVLSIQIRFGVEGGFLNSSRLGLYDQPLAVTLTSYYGNVVGPRAPVSAQTFGYTDSPIYRVSGIVEEDQTTDLKVVHELAIEAVQVRLPLGDQQAGGALTRRYSLRKDDNVSFIDRVLDELPGCFDQLAPRHKRHVFIGVSSQQYAVAAESGTRWLPGPFIRELILGRLRDLDSYQ